MSGEEFRAEQVARANDSQAMDKIAALLDGTEWDSTTISEVAEIVAATGRRVSEVP